MANKATSFRLSPATQQQIDIIKRIKGMKYDIDVVEQAVEKYHETVTDPQALAFIIAEKEQELQQLKGLLPV